MLNVIKSDLFRLFRGKAIYIIICVALILITISCFELSPGYIGISSGSDATLNEIDSQMTEEDMNEIVENYSLSKIREVMKKYPYELDRAIVGANANLYYLFIVIVVIVVSTDFSNGSVKNTISSAISRKKYYLSKLILCLLLCTGLILLNNYGTYFINILMNGESFSSSLQEITKITIYQLPLLYGIISLLVGVCFVVRKTSIFNTISIPFIMVFQLVLSGIIKLFSLETGLMNYELQMALGNLANNPTNIYIVKCLLLGIIYIIAFNLIGYYTFKKAEIK